MLLHLHSSSQRRAVRQHAARSGRREAAGGLDAREEAGQVGGAEVGLVEELAVGGPGDRDQGPGGGDGVDDGLGALDRHGVVLADEHEGGDADAVQAGGDGPARQHAAEGELAFALRGGGISQMVLGTFG